MALFKIPVTRAKRQYTAQAEFDGVNYSFKIYYNRRLDSWSMNFSDQVQGIHLVGGIDLLKQHKHKSVPQGTLALLDLEGLHRDPTLATLGDTIILTYESV